MTDQINLNKWVRVAFFNLMIVALLGVIMRYKISFYLPFINQSYFQHAHSNFAFTGWVTQILMVLMLDILNNYLPHLYLKKYIPLIMINLLCAYAMLLSFAISGYSIYSSSFSTASFIISWIFSIMFWIDLNKIKEKTISKKWFKAALLFNFISSFGVFAISVLMANKIHNKKWVLACSYLYLHFQYNGWFFFACMGLLSAQINSYFSYSLQNNIFWIFASACIPAYFLSASWIPISNWIYILVLMSAVAEVVGWILLLKIFFLKRIQLFRNLSSLTRLLLILSGTALTVKLLLQLGSTIPILGRLAFGLRPVIIGYLHLMFLGVISLFIIGYCKMKNFLSNSNLGKYGIIIFVAGIILNEFFLMIEGLSYMNNTNVPYINELLLGAAIFMLSGLIALNINYTRKSSIRNINIIPL